MASPSLPDPRPGLRCGRPTCPCRLPGASVHCPVCRAPKPSLDVAWRDGAWTLACANRCGGETVADAVRRLGLWPATPAPAGVHAPLGMSRLDAVTPRPLTWLWPGFVPNDALTLLIGAPGVGTSWLATDLAARVTTGGQAPDGNGRFPQGPVLIVTPDSPASSLLPRLDAQGADPAQVYVVESLRHADATEAAPRVQRDASHLGSLLAETDARLLIVDPIEAFAHGPLAQRRLLTALASIAVRTSTAVLAVAHQPYHDLAKALGRAHAMPTMARSVLLVGEHPRDDRYRFVVTTKTVAVPPGDGLLFRIRSRSGSRPLPRLIWDETTWAPDLLESPWRPVSRDEFLHDAWGLLQRMLAGGPRPAREVKQAATEAGIANLALYEARGELGVLTKRVNDTGPGSRGRGTWYWHLPHRGFDGEPSQATSFPPLPGEGEGWGEGRAPLVEEAKGLVPVLPLFHGAREGWPDGRAPLLPEAADGLVPARSAPG